MFHRQAWAGALAAIGVGLLLMVSIMNTQWPLAVGERLVAATGAVAMLLFEDALYIFSLQVIAVLLTAAVIGGVFLAKRETSHDPAEREMATLERLRPASPTAPEAVNAAVADGGGTV